jgi:N-acetylglutamate synthase-like GNAT family acetyltransferase
MNGPSGARRAGGPGAVRPAREDDLPALRSIERAAGRSFAALGMTLVAEDEPPPIEELRAYQRDGRAWVRTDRDDRAVAYLLADEVDGCAHLQQVTVHPDWAHRRLGQELLERLTAWATERHLPAITLTTFTDVPWNGPYYRRLGFRIVDDAQLTPGLRRIRRSEADRGLDAWPRAAMQLDL